MNLYPSTISRKGRFNYCICRANPFSARILKYLNFLTANYENLGSNYNDRTCSFRLFK